MPGGPFVPSRDRAGEGIGRASPKPLGRRGDVRSSSPGPHRAGKLRSSPRGVRFVSCECSLCGWPGKPVALRRPGGRRLLWFPFSGGRSGQRGPDRKGSAMAKNIYVGNLVWDATADDLYALFKDHGTVSQAQVITDRETGRSRGFGFVVMADDAEAQKGIEALNAVKYSGRQVTVDDA